MRPGFRRRWPWLLTYWSLPLAARSGDLAHRLVEKDLSLLHLTCASTRRAIRTLAPSRDCPWSANATLSPFPRASAAGWIVLCAGATADSLGDNTSFAAQRHAQGAGDHLITTVPATSAFAMTVRMMSFVPSPMLMSGASRYKRSTTYSVE